VCVCVGVPFFSNGNRGHPRGCGDHCAALPRDTHAHCVVRRRKLFHRSQLYDILRGLIYIAAMLAMNHWGQLSRAYHYIRGEAMIKLYVIFNILEVRVA